LKPSSLKLDVTTAVVTLLEEKSRSLPAGSLDQRIFGWWGRKAHREQFQSQSNMAIDLSNSGLELLHSSKALYFRVRLST